MKYAPAVALAFAALSSSVPGIVNAQTFPAVAGAAKFEVGLAGVVLPEDTEGSYSLQPIGRLGYFIAEGLEVQLEGSLRVWPSEAPDSYGVGVNAVWFPRLEGRMFFLLGGAGMANSSPSGGDSRWDGFARGALGFKIPLSELGAHFLQPWHLSVEYRGEFVFADELDYVSGAAFALAHFL